MPQDQRASVSSTGRQARRPSQIDSSQEQQHYHRREKTKSSPSYVQSPRRESARDNAAAQPAANVGATQVQRSPAKGRAHSAPLAPKSSPLPLADHDEAEVGSSFLDADPGPDDEDEDEDDDDVLEDEEEGIADDPFFQRFSFTHTVTPDDEPPSPDSPNGSTDTEGPLSPTSTQMRPRPDSTAEPLGSPLTPRGTSTVRRSFHPKQNVITANPRSGRRTPALGWKRST